MEKVDNPAQLALTDMTWVIQVARALLHDDSAADDVAQDAWLIAAHKAPRDGRPVRPWLVRVVKNLVRMRARGETRRAAREQRSVETVQPLPTPAELIERIETQRAVAGEVLALTEPYRSTVLLHYVEGLSSAEIARRQGIPDGTVRRRLKVALDEIRDRLRARDDGPKGGWLAALAPLAGLPGPATPPAKGWLLPAAVFALGVGAIALLVLLARRDVPPPVSDRGAPTAVHTSAHRAPVAAGVLGALVQPEVAPRRVAGTVMFDGKPVDHATVRLAAIVPDGPALPVAERTTASDGTFDFGLQPAATFVVGAEAAARTGASTRVDVADPRASADHVVLLLDGCTSRLFGKIRDASGGPVAAARVSFDGGATVADRAGMYSLCVPAGVRVRVEADGYGALSIPTYAPGEVHHDIVMVPESTVSGTIVDEANHPVPGALVTITPEGPDGGINPFALASNLAASDAAGRFVVDRLGPGMFRVAAVAEGFASPSPTRVFTQPGRPADLHVVVAGRVRVHGKVVVAGNPVAGARIQLVDPQLRMSNLVPPALASFSQPDGTFVLESARGTFDVLADPYDVASPAQLAVDGPTDATIEVTPRAAVRGRVTRHGVPVANAEIDCLRLPPATKARTDASGEFSFEGLPPGDNTLWAQSLALGAYGSRTFTLTAGQQASVDVELDGGARVSGTVIDDAKQPVPGVFVRLVAPTGDEGWCMTDARGAFECSSMAGGADYTADVHPSPDVGHPFLSLTRTVHLRDGDDVVTGLEIPITLDRLAIRGRVLDDTGAPVPDCHVTAAGGMRAPATMDGIMFLSPWTRTAVDGGFQISNLAHGPYTVAVACPDGGLGERFDVMPGGSSLDISIARAGTITGHVVGFTTSPIVHTERITPGTIMGYVAIRDGDRFTLHGIPPDRYPVEALAGAQTDAQLVDLHPGATADITLTARPATTISGRVVELGTHKPIAGMQCETRVSADGFAGTLEPMPRSTATDATGQFSVTAPVGHVRVLCGGAGGFSAAGGDVDVSDSGAHDVEAIAVRVTGAPSDIGFRLRPWRLPLTVFAIRPDGPATGSGLAVGDQLVAIDGAPVSGLVPDAAGRLLENHPAGTPMRLTVERAGASVIVEIVPRVPDTPPPP